MSNAEHTLCIVAFLLITACDRHRPTPSGTAGTSAEQPSNANSRVELPRAPAPDPRPLRTIVIYSDRDARRGHGPSGSINADLSVDRNVLMRAGDRSSLLLTISQPGIFGTQISFDPDPIDLTDAEYEHALLELWIRGLQPSVTLRVGFFEPEGYKSTKTDIGPYVSTLEENGFRKVAIPIRTLSPTNASIGALVLGGESREGDVSKVAGKLAMHFAHIAIIVPHSPQRPIDRNSK